MDNDNVRVSHTLDLYNQTTSQLGDVHCENRLLSNVTLPMSVSGAPHELPRCRVAAAGAFEAVAEGGCNTLVGGQPACTGAAAQRLDFDVDYRHVIVPRECHTLSSTPISSRGAAHRCTDTLRLHRRQRDGRTAPGLRARLWPQSLAAGHRNGAKPPGVARSACWRTAMAAAYT